VRQAPTQSAQATSEGPARAAVHVAGLRKNYGDVVAVDDVELTVREGEFFTLPGPSGSGKTSLLRLIAGFERPDAGRIELGGRDVTRTPRGWQTLRLVTLPMLMTAGVSGALLAFALSFDEVIVTVFTAGAQNTLPLWIFGAIRLGQQLPEVNAVVTFVIALTIIPVVIAARVAGTGAITRSARNVPVATSGAGFSA
jgi:ABC-type cobalamin/Fe3+-siderophores transport system ATPase subunit